MSKKILVVEDEKNIAELERDYLEANGYTVEIEFDGKTDSTRPSARAMTSLSSMSCSRVLTASRSAARYANTRSAPCSWSPQRRTR